MKIYLVGKTKMYSIPHYESLLILLRKLHLANGTVQRWLHLFSSILDFDLAEKRVEMRNGGNVGSKEEMFDRGVRQPL